VAVPLVAIAGILMAAYAAHQGQKQPRGSASRRSYNYMFWGGVGGAFMAPAGAAGGAAVKGTAASGAVNYSSKLGGAGAVAYSKAGAAGAAAGSAGAAGAQSAPAAVGTAYGGMQPVAGMNYSGVEVAAREPATQSTVQTGPGFWDSMTRDPKYYGQTSQPAQQSGQSPYTRMLQQGFGGQPQAVEQPTPQPPPRREQRPFEDLYRERDASVAAGEEPAGRHGAARWGADFWWS
jgi:hypothetical protein